MYNLSNLNDYEFEILAKDIMQKKLKTALFRFKRGKDGGVDLCDSKITIKHLVQVKHYIKSGWPQLKSALKLEVSKVEKLNPDNYYVICSTELTRENKLEIIEMFPKYIKNLSQILDGIDINDFLNESNNIEIVKKNYKLWFASTNILSLINNQAVFIDSEVLLEEIEKDIKLFVKTKAYLEAEKLLELNNVLVVIGGPGVGKTTISKMLLIKFVSKEYVARYVSTNNISDIKKSLSSNPDKKEIILLDDFLGQHYLKFKEETPNELKALISYVKRNGNKKLILNSRITILNEARYSSIQFNTTYEDKEVIKYLIDLDKKTIMDKARILYNHLYFYEVNNEHFSQIRSMKKYKNIIMHSNFNPRVIEYCSKESKKREDIDNFYEFLITKLNNQDEVWDNEFRNRLEEVDRIFMNTLYSLTDTTLEVNLLKEAFNKRIATYKQIPTTRNIFEDVYKRLNDSLIKTSTIKVLGKNQNVISVVNPSVNDYLRSNLKRNELEQKTIIENAYFIEQVEKMFKLSTRNLTYFTEDLLALGSINENVYKKYLDIIVTNEIRDNKIIESVKQCFLKICQDTKDSYQGLVVDLLTDGYESFYDLKQIFIDNIEQALTYFYYGNIEEVYLWLKKEKYLNENIEIILINHYTYAVEMYLEEKLNQEISQLIYDVIDHDMDLMVRDKEIDYKLEHYIELVDEAIFNSIEYNLNKIYDESHFKFNKELINFDNVYYSINVESEIEQALKEDVMELNDNLNEGDEKNTWEYIEEMFE